MRKLPSRKPRARSIAACRSAPATAPQRFARTTGSRRLRREPLQYILGDAHFRELVLKVDRRVLIPRPETEVLVGEVLRDGATGRTGDGATGRGGDGATALEIGTGSGAIALSLLKE